MRTALTVGTVVALIRATMAQNPTVNTPTSLVQCQPALISFSGGTAPYFISVLPGGQSTATPLESFPEQTGTSYTWTVDIAAGTSITLSIRDSTGALNYSQQVTVQPGTSTSCASGSGASSAATSTAASATSAASSAGSIRSNVSSAASSAASSASSAASSVASSASSRASSVSSRASSVSSASASSASAASPSASNSGVEGLRVAGSGALALIGTVLMGLFA